MANDEGYDTHATRIKATWSRYIIKLALWISRDFYVNPSENLWMYTKLQHFTHGLIGGWYEITYLFQFLVRLSQYELSSDYFCLLILALVKNQGMQSGGLPSCIFYNKTWIIECACINRNCLECVCHTSGFSVDVLCCAILTRGRHETQISKLIYR